MSVIARIVTAAPMRRAAWRLGWVFGTSRREPTYCLDAWLPDAASAHGGSTGTALFEKPYLVGRDAVDLITTVGVSRRLLPALYAGVEMIGEDLEGFWEIEEAEGGARVLVGPSFRIAAPTKRWYVNAAGGPIVHATRSGRSSAATRGLPSSSSSAGYGARVPLGYGF